QDNNVFVSFNGNRAVTGNEDGWKSISDRFDKDFVRGEMIYKEEDGKLLTNKFTFDDAKVLEKIGEAITAEYFYSTDTSQGEGVVIETGEQSYTLYVDNQPVLEFQDNKEILERSRGEQQMYVDIEKKRLFFAQSYGDYGTVNGIDLDSGNPLFIDGKLKELETTRSVDIIGDGEGNLFVVEYGDFEGLIRISAFDSDLDLLVGPFDVPVRDSDEVAVTVTKDEVHIWAYHRYEMEPALE
ncbi:hypothetical protein D8T51_23965, partial [Vibrio vulnificus]|uniref:hypothetical protein n=1 Tax=Vibrio vulnificus TaxID=672 RepID=UPI0010EDC90B